VGLVQIKFLYNTVVAGSQEILPLRTSHLLFEEINMLLFYWIDVPQNIPINKLITRRRRYATFINPPVPCV
jgi:hypothetical protein